MVVAAVAAISCSTEVSTDAVAPVSVSRQPLSQGRLSAHRAQAGLAALTDGTLLITGGLGPDQDPTMAMAQVSADIYDPERGRVVWSGTMLHPHAGHTTTLLDDGRVLIAGGGVPYAELFDPASRSFTAAANMADSRTGHSATKLPDGRVLVVGGGATSAQTCQIYDPSQNAWGNAPSLAVARQWHVAVLNTLVDPAVVLVVGGTGNGSSGNDFRTPEVYEPIANTWTAYAKIPTGIGAGANGGNALLLPDGGVLVSPTWNESLGDANRNDSSSYVFTGTGWTSWGVCNDGLIGQSALMLPDGQPYSMGSYGDGSGCNFIKTQFIDRHLRVFSPTMSAGSYCIPVSSLSLDDVRREANTVVTPGGWVLQAGGLQFYACGYNILDSVSVLRTSAMISADAGTLQGNGRLDAVAAPLWSGDVIVTGGNDGTASLATAEVVSGATGAVLRSLPLSAPRSQHTATLLRDGRVLVAGGVDDAGTPLATVDVLNPADGGTVLGLSLHHARAAHTATLLGDGRVLLIGGVSDGGVTSTSELFDPATGQSVDTGPLTQRRSHHGAALLPDGTVVVAGGQIGSSVLRSAERFSLDAGSFLPLSDLATSRTDFTITEVAGQAVVVGGSSTAGSSHTPLASVEVLPADAGAWVAGPSLSTARYGHTASVLPSGLVVVAAGYNAASPLSSTELLDPQSGAFSAGPNLLGPRGRHAAVVAGGRALLIGGELDARRVEVVAEAPISAPAFVPSVQPPASAASPGAAFALTGNRFTGYGDNGGGTYRATATNFPLFLVTRAEGDGRRYLRTTSWSATTATVQVPPELSPGSYWLRVSVGGALSAPVRLVVGLANGHACASGDACASGLCINGGCCADAACGADAGTGGGAGGGAAGGGSAGGGGSATGGGNAGGGDTGGGSTGGGTAGNGGGADQLDGGVGQSNKPDLFSCGCSSDGGGAALLSMLAFGWLLTVRRRRGAPTAAWALLCAALVAGWAPQAAAQPKMRVAIMRLKALGGVKSDAAQVVTSQLSSAVQARGYQVMSSDEIEAKLGLERQRALLGCAESSCLAEIGDALGVDKLISGSLATVGASAVISLSLINNHSGTVEYRYSQRVKNASEEAFLDLVPTAVSALFPNDRAGVGAGRTGADGHVEADGALNAGAVRRWGIDVRGSLATQGLAEAHLHGSIAVLATFRFIPNLEVGLGALVSKTPGGLVRLGWVPFAAKYWVHPLVAAELPVLVANGAAAVGVTGAVGVELLPVPLLAIRAEIPVSYFFTPAAQTNLFVFGQLSVGVRL